MHVLKNLMTGAGALVLSVSLTACAQSGSKKRTDPKTVPTGTSSGDQGLKKYELNPASLAPPSATEDATNPPRVIPQSADAVLQMPAGFEARSFAEGGFKRARWMALAPNGDIFVTDADADSVIILRGIKEDGTVRERFTFATGLNKPFGMAFNGDNFYVANTNAVVRFKYKSGQTKAEGPPEKITDLPGRGYREHWTRNIIFNPQGTKLYVTIGSQSNVDVEPEPRASILEMNPDGSARREFAKGLRNPVGLDFSPVTGQLWA